METISVRLENVKGLDLFSKISHLKRSFVIRELLEEGKKMKALELYKQKKVSIGLASKLAGLTLSEFIDLLKEYNISLNLDLDDAEEAMKTARKVL